MSVLPERPGLRERKKARTRAAIREHAFRLFRDQGYDATTVEQIADAAEVSPSTFFRYFPTKEDVVLQDELDLVWAEAVRTQADLSPLAALRGALRSAFAAMPEEELAQLRESTGLAFTVPAVRARSLDELARTVTLIAGAVGERAGRSPDDFAVRALAGAVVGVAFTAWFAANGDIESFGDHFEQGLALLESGLPL